jgi:hypothetical protein
MGVPPIKCEIRHSAGCHSSRHLEKRKNMMIELLPKFWAITYNHHPNGTSDISNMKLATKYDFFNMSNAAYFLKKYQTFPLQTVNFPFSNWNTDIIRPEIAPMIGKSSS